MIRARSYDLLTILAGAGLLAYVAMMLIAIFSL